MISEGKFVQALETNNLTSYEQSYCLYRLHKYSQALDAIESESELKFLHLKAQIYHRSENYQMAAKTYAEILDQTDPSDPCYMELVTNCNAVAANATAANCILDRNILCTSSGFFEADYNLALVRTAQLRLDEALQLLEKARSTCNAELEQEGYSEEEIKRESIIITTQIGHVYQLLGRKAEAHGLFLSILDSGFADQATRAIVQNNLAVLSENRLESIRRLKAAYALETKLTAHQKLHVCMNSVLLGLKHNSTQKLAQKFPRSEIPHLIIASKKKKSLEVLKVNITNKSQSSFTANPSSLGLCLAVVQHYNSAGEIQAAWEILDSFLDSASKGLKYSFGMISLVVWLLESLDNVQQVKEFLTDAQDYYAESGLLTGDTVSIKAFAKYKLGKGLFESAAKDLARVVKESMDDIDAIASLVLAYCQVDLEKAQQYVGYLPPCKDQDSNLDVQVLESAAEFITSKARPVAKESALTKKKRKRRGKLPKDLHVKLDPERWISKNERSNNKKGKRDLNKGPQGINLSGGGIGQTGSAKIENIKSAAIAETAVKPMASKKGRKKRK